MSEITDEQPAIPCQDKLRFDDRKAAEAAALTAKWQRGINLKAYKCKDCELWHLATNT